MNEKTAEFDRRFFLKKIVKSFLIIFSIISAGIYFLFAYPLKIRKKKTVFVYACDELELPVRGVRQFYVNYPLRGKTVNKKIFIVNTVKEMFILSAVCTHLGCLVSWYRPENRFLCPCHDGQYDINGNVAAGPPPAPLNRLPLKIKQGKVFVGLRL
jgi:cytochrome b6-f complex iron-sulfur subunit